MGSKMEPKVAKIEQQIDNKRIPVLQALFYRFGDVLGCQSTSRLKHFECARAMETEKRAHTIYTVKHSKNHTILMVGPPVIEPKITPKTHFDASRSTTRFEVDFACQNQPKRVAK